jgi:hypothetical protein
VARGSTAGDILILAFRLVLMPPTLLVAIEALLYRVSRLRRAVHLAFIALLAAVFALQVLADIAPRTTSVLLIPLAVIAGTAIAVSYRRTRFVPSMLNVLSPAPVLFLALFLLFSDVSKLVFPADAQDVRHRCAATRPWCSSSSTSSPVSIWSIAAGASTGRAFRASPPLRAARPATGTRLQSCLRNASIDSAIQSTISSLSPG